MRKIFTILLIFIFTNLFAQNKFELGYYIDQSGNKVEGEISEIQINNFPDNFIFRNGKNTEVIQTSLVSKIKYGIDVFEKRQFQYDLSTSNDLKKMSKQKDVELEDKTAFLQLIVDGRYKLYKYVNNGTSVFFYEDASGQLTTLNYKKYVENGTDIKENKEYLTQLSQNVQSDTKKKDYFSSAIKYNDADLIDYFIKVNNKSVKKERKSQVKFIFFTGYSVSTMDINFLQDIGSEKYQHITVMPEVEYILNKNLINPTSFYFNVKYRSIKADYEEVYVRKNWHHKVDYQSLCFSIGAKQYFLSSDKVQLYGKLGIGYDNPLKAEILSPMESWNLNPIFFDQPSAGINSGLGVKLYNSFLIELDYDYLFKTLFVNKNTSLNLKVGYSF